MSRLQLILVVIIIILGGVFGGVLYRNKHLPTPAAEMCPTDTMACPDGTTVARSGPNCEFGICKQELPSYMEPLPVESATTTSTTTSSSTGSTGKPTEKKTVVKKVTESVAAVVQKVADVFTKEDKPTTPVAQNNQAQNQNNQAPTSEKNATFNETRYSIKNGSIVDDQGNIIYTFPPTSTGADGWTTHVVNVVPTNSIAAIINSIPIIGQPGQFYLSENSLGNVENCEFSNKVYILDTQTGKKVLMYEENSNTLGATVARSCTSELYLLATEGEKLILKSHTVGTGTTCEGTWSEPDQTWYLDVTKLDKGLRRYIISPALYQKTEAEEKACRVPFDATSSPADVLGG